MICQVCQHLTESDHHKNFMGGPPGAICFFCFLAWYEEGLVYEEAIRRRSIALRETGWPQS